MYLLSGVNDVERNTIYSTGKALRCMKDVVLN